MLSWALLCVELIESVQLLELFAAESFYILDILLHHTYSKYNMPV